MGTNKIIIGEELYKKKEQLEKVHVDKDSWCIYFIDPLTNEKWVEEYPNAEYHGGGAPQLRLINQFPWEECGGGIT